MGSSFEYTLTNDTFLSMYVSSVGSDPVETMHSEAGTVLMLNLIFWPSWSGTHPSSLNSLIDGNIRLKGTKHFCVMPSYL